MGMDLLEVREELDTVLTVFSNHLASIAYSFSASVDVMVWVEQVRIGRCAAICRLQHQALAFSDGIGDTLIEALVLEIEIRMLLVNINIVLMDHIVDFLGLIIILFQVIKVIINQCAVELKQWILVEAFLLEELMEDTDLVDVLDVRVHPDGYLAPLTQSHLNIR